MQQQLAPHGRISGKKNQWRTLLAANEVRPVLMLLTYDWF